VDRHWFVVFYLRIYHLVNQLSVDYMDRRRIFTVDPDYFPLDRMREIISYLHDHDQKFSMQLSLSP